MQRIPPDICNGFLSTLQRIPLYIRYKLLYYSIIYVMLKYLKALKISKKGVYF